MVADPIVGVAVDIAQMSSIQLGELGVELRLGLLLAGEPLIAPYPPTALTQVLRRRARDARSRSAAISHREIALAPPSHSHCRLTHAQMRSATPRAIAGEGRSACGKRSGRPQRRLTLRGRIRQPRRTSSVPMHSHRDDGSPSLQSKPPHPSMRMAEWTGTHTGPLREDHDTVASLENRASGSHRLLVAVATIDRKGPKAVEQPSLPATLEQLALGHVVDGPTRQRADHERVEEAAVVGREQHGAGAGDVLASEAGRCESRAGRKASRTARTSQ